jgi:hypothetical protein
MTAKTNLPERQINDSGARTKLFFDTYGKEPLEFNATEVDATIGFFKSRGFSDDAAQSISLSILKQAKLENIKIFGILDDLKKLDDLQISGLVSEVLNNNRPATSTLGYREPTPSISKQRNVVP